MTSEDVVLVLGPVAALLDELGVAYYIGGSTASSAHGFARSTNDIDVVAMLELEHAQLFVQRFQSDYYLSADAMRDAIQRRGSFNLVHHETGNKVDVFLSRQRPYDEAAMSRRRQQEFEDEPFELSFWIAAPEDVLLAKLEWFRAGGEVSEKQWGDISGVLKVQRDDLDFAYLAKWAAAIEVSDLLGRAFEDAGIEKGKVGSKIEKHKEEP